jgi:hypothetical protein
MTKEEADEIIELIEKLKKDIRDFKTRLGNENAELKADHDKQLTKAKEIILKLYNAGRDVLMCRAEEKAYDNLDEAISDKSIEQFLKEEICQ